MNKDVKDANGPTPTWHGDIKNMFTERDIKHMLNVDLRGIDLSSYEYVSGHANLIYQQVASHDMPRGGPYWSDEWVVTFLLWMQAGCPQGTPAQTRLFGAKLLRATLSPVSRIRKDLASLTSEEQATLVRAFKGIMNLPPTDPNSYFFWAGYHWLPAPNFYCMHHAPAYNSWHRVFMVGFENALRSIRGCENVTLPYWDLTSTTIPPILYTDPFNAYIYQEDVGPAPYNLKGKPTQRFDAATILANLASSKVTDKVNKAMSQTSWEGFNGLLAGTPNNTIISAHDNAHNSIGPNMQDQNVAAFDPIFWFFHANLDRLFWEWQIKMSATTQVGLLRTIMTDVTSRQTFTIPTVAKLPPFTANPPTLDAINSIDLRSLDIDYAPPATKTPEVELVPETRVASLASKNFSVKTDLVNVRVSGLNRMKIPGSFNVHLLKDGKVIETNGFFQPHEADKCENCVQYAVAHFDFEIPLSEVADGKLGVWVEPIDKDFVGDRIPGNLMGNPTVEVSFLVSNG